MPTEPRWSDQPSSGHTLECAAAFAGRLEDVTDARVTAELFLAVLGRTQPPSAPEHWDDILLVVTELAANAVQYAPGPFRLTLRRTFDGVHVTLGDTNTTPPAPRAFRPGKGGGGIGWYLIQTLCDQVSVVVHKEPQSPVNPADPSGGTGGDGAAEDAGEVGKDVHVFLPW
ncbi:ATP-binding protein [Streptomyces sp. NPDC005017]|uniref:ATP-binding protein n=1 Tax=Streptomyces sp. NPDC005017 TaxID=3364706 RepID=UPI0036AD7044